ncbi:hypothetical protein LCGC14_0863180 [marine sediment metagenome]|uniref:Uncharacterized protein n=1 Tax=marine sediment metagenome TaxID=412755 RepID=A0A0F9RRF7_9ZZZZ
MNAKNKIKLIFEILDRYEDGSCLYCGNTLKGDLEEFDEFYSNDWCPDCTASIDPDDNWEETCLNAISLVIQDKKFKP